MRIVVVVVVGCVLAIAGSAVAVVKTVETSHETDRNLARGLEQVVKIGCDRDRQFTTQLRTLVQRGRDNARRYRNEGVITQEQYERAIAENDRALRLLALPDCKAVVLLVSK